jgi:phage terminase large subunit
MSSAVELRHRYRGRGAALKLMSCRDDEILLSGPAGTGKSRACLEKLQLAALKYPGMTGLVVRQVRDTLAGTALRTWDKFVIKEQLLAGSIVYRGSSGREPARYEFSNGSQVWIAGLDKPSKIMSTEFDMVYIQEATEVDEDGWQALTTRLGRTSTMPYNQLIADCNPDSPTHWLKLRADAGTTTMLESRHEDNPTMWDAAAGEWTVKGLDYIRRLDRLTGVQLLRLRHGKWAAAEGICWPGFDTARHIVDPFPIPQDWPRIWTVDFGMVHPFVWQAWAIAPDGEMYRYREIHMTGRLVEDHARQIMGIVRPGAQWDDQERRWHGGTWIEPKPQKIICDHDAEDRATLTRYLCMPTTPADKRVKLGIEAVERRWRDNRLFLVRSGDVVLRQVLPGNRDHTTRYGLIERDPVLVSARKPTCTEEEIGGYVWDDNKEAPVKDNDDGADTTRYGVAHFDLKAQLTNARREVWV